MRKLFLRSLFPSSPRQEALQPWCHDPVMCLGIGLNKSDKPITRMMYYPTNALLASVFAMSVIVLEDDHRLFLAITRMFDVASMKVAIVAVIPANWADPLLVG